MEVQFSKFIGHQDRAQSCDFSLFPYWTLREQFCFFKKCTEFVKTNDGDRSLRKATNTIFIKRYFSIVI